MGLAASAVCVSRHGDKPLVSDAGSSLREGWNLDFRVQFIYKQHMEPHTTPKFKVDHEMKGINLFWSSIVYQRHINNEA